MDKISLLLCKMTYDHHWWVGTIEFCALYNFSCVIMEQCAASMKPLNGPCYQTIQVWCLAWLNHGKIGPSRKRTEKGWRRVLSVHLELAKNILDDVPTTYYEELCAQIAINYGVLYNKQQMCDALHAAGCTRKVNNLDAWTLIYWHKLYIKVLEYRAMEQSAPLRQLYRVFISRFDSRMLVFFDETHLAPNDIRRKYGLSFKNMPAFWYVYII